MDCTKQNPKARVNRLLNKMKIYMFPMHFKAICPTTKKRGRGQIEMIEIGVFHIM